MTRVIPVGKQFFALVDDADYARVAAYRWAPHKSAQTLYAMAKIDGKTTYLHRFVMAAERGTTIDHSDGNGLNCQRWNLRSASQTQQNANQRKRSGRWRFKGIEYHTKKGRWRGSVEIRGRVHRGKWRQSDIDAACDYDDLARLHFGEFARVNFPREGERAA